MRYIVHDHSPHRLLFLAVVVLAFACFAAPLGAAEDASSPSISKKTLDNGLTVVVKPEPGSGLVAIVAAVRVGAAQEGFQNAGIGSFVARLLLAGTRLSSAEEIAAVSDEVGGNIGTQWHPDFTEVRVVTTSTLFDKAMRLVGEILTEANFEQKWVDQVRADVLSDMKNGAREPYQAAYDDLRGLLYTDSGYRRPTSGFERTVKLATPEDLRSFHSRYYVPNNMVVSVVGDVTVDHAVKRVDGAFAGVPAGKLPPNRGMPDEKLERSTYHAVEAEVPVAYLMTGWLAPPISSEDFAPVMVATTALGGGKGSLMFRNIRQERGLGYDLGALYPGFRYQSHVLAYVYTDPYKLVLPNLRGSLVLEEVKTALLEQVESLKKTPLSEKDLQRAKGYTIGTYALSLQHLMDRAYQLAWLESIGVGFEHYRGFPSDVEKVTAEDVQRVARKYFTNYAAVLLMPKTQSPPAATAE